MPRVHRTGAPWRDLPDHYGLVGMVSSRFYRWRKAGIWDSVLSALQAEADARGEVDRDLHFVDATIIRAHQHAAGARRTGVVGVGENAGALGHSQGGFSTKLHLRAEGLGKPMVAVLTGGERHEQIALGMLLDNGAIRRASRGRPRLRPRRPAGDKGYSSPTARSRLHRWHVRPVIPSKSNQRRQPCFDLDAYRQRNRIERLKQFRRIATRYEKRSGNYLAMVMLGMVLLWLQPSFADTPQKPDGDVLDHDAPRRICASLRRMYRCGRALESPL